MATFSINNSNTTQKSHAYTNDEDPGLQDLVSLIIPELDEEVFNNLEFRQSLCESPLFNAEEDSSSHKLNDHQASFHHTSTIHQTNEAATATNHPWLNYTDLSHLSFPIMPSQPDETVQDDGSLSPLMNLNLFNTTNTTKRNYNRRQSEPVNILNPNHLRHNDPIKEIGDLLIEMDDDENGWIDFSEFEEAMQLIDNNMIHSEIEAMYDFMTNSEITHKYSDKSLLLRSESAFNTFHQPQYKSPKAFKAMRSPSRSRSSSSISDFGELNIKQFVHYISIKYSEYNHEHKQAHDNKHHVMMRRMVSEAHDASLSSLNDERNDAKHVIRVVFHDIFHAQARNQMEVTTTNVWGVLKLSSLERLKNELIDEADDAKTLDLPEFKTAMHNLGVQLDKKNANEIVFEHFIAAQSVSITCKNMQKRKELNIEFFIKYMDDNLDTHSSMQPKEILEKVLSNVMNEGISRKTASRQNILNVNYNNREHEAKSDKSSPNPYFDGDLMDGLSKDFAPDKIKKFEKRHEVIHNEEDTENSASGRKLVRLDSSSKWEQNELDDLELQMTKQFELLCNAQTKESDVKPFRRMSVV